MIIKVLAWARLSRLSINICPEEGRPVATGPFLFYLSISTRGKKGLRDRKREEVYVAAVNAAARREGGIWLDLSVRPTYV